MLSSDVLIICFLSLYIARNTELFDKRIKPWEFFLSEKTKKNLRRELCIDLDFQTDQLLPDSIMTLCTPYYLSLISSLFSLFSL